MIRIDVTQASQGGGGIYDVITNQKKVTRHGELQAWQVPVSGQNSALQ